jgi:acetyltransferase-like isoleucine patch superfamily enzyme
MGGESDSPFQANDYHPLAWIIGEPTIGEGCWIGPFTVIDGSGGLTIGRGVDVSCGAQIYTHSTVRRCISARAVSEVERQPTTIGDFVFIGANASVMMGVNVGDRSVVAAGAVVVDDVPPATIVAGVPARAIGTVIFDGDRVELRYSQGEP